MLCAYKYNWADDVPYTGHITREMKSSGRHFTTGAVWLVVVVFAAIHTLSVAAQISQAVCSNTSSWVCGPSVLAVVRVCTHI